MDLEDKRGADFLNVFNSLESWRAGGLCWLNSSIEFDAAAAAVAAVMAFDYEI